VAAGAGSALRRCTALPRAVVARSWWGRAASLSRAEELGDTGFADLITLEDIDRLVARQGLRTPFLRLARDGETVPERRYTRGGGVGATIADQIADDQVTRLFADGSTIVLQALHRTHGPLIDFAGQLTAELGHPVQVNAYVTPPQSRGFDHHYDVHDVFVLQVAGEKRWEVHHPVREHPARDEPWTDHREDVARVVRTQDPVLDDVLRPGDALYLPRGFIHAASALGGVSAHLTVGIHPWTGLHVVDAVLPTAKARAELRAPLDLGVDLGSEDDIRRHVDAVLDALARHIEDLRRSPDALAAVAATLARRADQSGRGEPVGPLRQSSTLATLTSRTVLRLRRGVRADLHEHDGQIELRTAETTVRMPRTVRDALERLVGGDLVPAGDLGTEHSATLLRQALAVAADHAGPA
jgi:hypothetical protein